jgi:regulator of protease activity HflC (stomatin/prohibitin superfamily)
MEIVVLSGLIGALSAVLLARWTRRVTVYEYQAGLKFKRGRLTEVLPAGIHWYLRSSSDVMLLDTRARTVTVPGQEVLTRDNVSVKLSLLATFQIKDARKATLASESFETALYAELQQGLRIHVGSLSVEELVAHRADLADAVQAAVRERAAALGLEVQAVGIKDIMFPGSLREVFAQVTRARQEGLAALERARGESAAMRSLANTARVMEGNPYLFQLRLLQSIADAKAGTLVVHVPQGPEGTAAQVELQPADQ